MRRLVTLILPILLAICLSAAPVAAAPQKSKAGALRQDQVFRAIYPAAPASLDPHGPPDPAAWPVIMACYNRLVTMTEGSAKPVPSLAQTIRVSPDGLKYTFILHEGMTFSDGTVVNTDAAFFTFDRLMSSEVGRRYYPHLHRFEPLGPYSFRLILSRPWPPFLASLALPQASLISPGLNQRAPSYLDARTLGSGNYTVYDWKDDTIGIQQRPELPARNKVGFAMFHFEPDPEKRYEKMTAHDAHLTIAPKIPDGGPPEKFRVIKVPGFSVRYLAFNTGRAYTRMQTTRRAMSFIIRDAFKDRPGRMDGPFPAGLFHDSPRRAEPPEVGRADRLTQAAVIIGDVGPPPGPLTLLIRAGDDSLARDAEAIIRALVPYGFNINPLALDGARLRQALETGDFDLFLDTRTADIPSADMWLGRFLDPASSVDGNPAFFNNSQAARLINEINTMVGQPGDGPHELAAVDRDRAAKVAELAEIALTEAPYVFLYQLEFPMVVDERLINQRPHPMWPEIWPIDHADLKPFSVRSGANPTGKRPAPAQAPPADVPDPSPAEEPVRPYAPAPEPPEIEPEPDFSLSAPDEDQAPGRLEGENPAPGFDEFIGEVLP